MRVTTTPMQHLNNKISSFSVILTFVFFTIVGLALLVELPVKLSPSEVLPRITVSYGFQGASPTIVEREVSAKIEAMLARMRSVKNIRSSSANGHGSVVVEFDKTVDIAAARFEMSTIVRQAWPTLPQGVSYPQLWVQAADDNANATFMSFSVVSPENTFRMQQFAEANIKNILAQTKGVSMVSVSGATPMEWQLTYDFEQLQALDITTTDIQTAVSQFINTQTLGLGAIISNNNEKRYVRLAFQNDLSTDAEALFAGITVKNSGARLVRLNDIVRIQRVQAQPSSYYRINGLNTVYITIEAEQTANQLQLAKEIKAKIAQINAHLPPNYRVDAAYDATEYIRTELNKIYFRTALTLIILFLFVLLVYRRLKYLLLIALSLFMNIAIALIFYYLLDVEIQLYSLAGITISLTLIIDNIIVLSDQIINRGNMKTFLAILASTITTVASLSVIFFLDEKIRLRLVDFSAVVIINLLVSLFVALFLVPALIEKLNISKKNKSKRPLKAPFFRSKFWLFISSKRPLVVFRRIYAWQIKLMCRRPAIAIILAILIFGLPIFMLPEKWEAETKAAKIYNATLGTDFYKQKIKPITDVALGGTLRLFVQKVYEGSYFDNKREETALYVNATLPNGATLEQMNKLIQTMEQYIAGHSEVRQFETNINSANRANIAIRFHNEHANGSFPFILKSKLISRSLELGGGSWSVYGVGDGFSNDLRENAGSYRASLYGYNYDQLYEYAEQLRNNMLEYRRIKEVSIVSEYSWYKSDYSEYTMRIDQQALANANVTPMQLYAAMSDAFVRKRNVGYFFDGQNNEMLNLSARQANSYDLWHMHNAPFVVNNTQHKLGALASIEKTNSPQRIIKINQEYQLCLQYDYIGAYEQGQRIHKEIVDNFAKEMAIGYRIKNDSDNRGRWGNDEKKNYALLAIVFIIIYFCSSILFNSLKQSLHIVFIIPLSFVGVFLTFYLFELTFDSGGFAAFILLSGLTVNANIYVIDEFNNYMRLSNMHPAKAYLRAWNAKVRPMFLTIVSTALGFVPFLVGNKESFWFALAAASVGGLLFSFVAIYFILPVLVVGKIKK